MNNKKEVRKLMAIMVVVVVFVVISLIVLWKYSVGPSQPNPIDAKNVSVPGVPTQTIQQEQQDKNSFQVGLLINKLPYSGQYFSLYYDLKSDVFTLYLNPQHQQEGRTQFISFLNSNGVKDESWLQNLTTTYTKPK